MLFESIDAAGVVKIQRVLTKPVWGPDDMGRIIYVIEEKILYYGTSEGWNRCTGFGLRPVLVINNYTAEDQDLCLVDTRNGPVTITLPASPKIGSEIGIVDVAGTFETNYCTLQANGKKMQRLDKNLVLDINDFSGSIIYDPLTSSWKVNIDGVVQLLGNATVWVHKSKQIAVDMNGAGTGQAQFNFTWEYNPFHDNIAVYVQGVKQADFEKTNQNSITLEAPVPAGTIVEICSIPLEGAFDIEEFATFTVLERDYTKTADLLTYLKTVDGSGSGLDADLLDGQHLAAIVRKTELLAEILKVDGSGSGIDADMTDGFHASKTSAANTIPVTDANGRLDPLFLPYGKSGLEVVSAFDIPGGASVIEFPNLDEEAGYMIKIWNMSPIQNDVNLFCRAYNKTQAAWQPFENWSASYTTATSGGLRDFNTATDMLVAKHVGATYYGINFVAYVDGFTSTNTYAPTTVTTMASFMSTDSNYASLYQSMGVFRKSNDVFSALRFYFDNGLIGATGKAALYKFSKSVV